MQSKFDPLKAIFLYPKDDNYVNDLIYATKLAVEQKYGERFKTDKTIMKMFDLLQQQIDDDKIKAVVLTFFLVWEKSLRDEVSPTECSDFDAFIIKMDEFVEKTIKFPINEHNIIEIIDNYFEAALAEFWMGPF